MSRKLVVLCVEDQELQLKARKLLFESAGYDVVEARSAAQAVQLFQSGRIDAVVMDYWLSDGRNGTTAAEQMKRIDPHIPIIMLSTFTSLPGESTFVDTWMRKGETEPELLLQEVKRVVQLREPSTGSAPGE